METRLRIRKEVESEAWHAFLAFEARHHILAERSSIADKLKPQDKSKLLLNGIAK